MGPMNLEGGSFTRISGCVLIKVEYRRGQMERYNIWYNSID
jgi:hypothetical protein